MANSYIKTIKDVFSSKNILAIAITTSLITLSDMGWRPFWSLYLKNELGASIAAVGLLSMIQSSERLVFQLPGGILADKWGRRKIIILGTALRIITPILYLFATHWTHVFWALLVNGATSIYMPAFNAIIADSLPETERGAGYGAYRMITSTPRIFSPIIGGVIMDSFGYLEGVRIFLLVSLVVNVIVTLVRWRVITETLVVESESKRIPGVQDKKSLRENVKETFDLPRMIWKMVVVAVLGSFGTRMVMDFSSIYAVEIIGLSNTQLGLVSTTAGFVTAALALPGGMLSDRFGRKPMIVISRAAMPISLFFVTISTNFQQYFIVQALNSLANALGGGGGRGRAGGPAWNALIADIVPREKRGTVQGTIGTVTGIVSAPASILGSYLWTNLGPQFPFYAASLTGLVGVLVFFLTVKEPGNVKSVELPVDRG
ncbi:MAG: MFS transporter [Candidatus Bathyarchaeota archaeon]|nr:MAG: MFS transporter [Candidatus Bathyarchaeota archaeon]